MANLLKGQRGYTYVLEKGWSQEYEKGVVDDDGIIRDEEGRSYSAGAYEVVAYQSECGACGSTEFNLISGTTQLVCVSCGHR